MPVTHDDIEPLDPFFFDDEELRVLQDMLSGCVPLKDKVGSVYRWGCTPRTYEGLSRKHVRLKQFFGKDGGTYVDYADADEVAKWRRIVKHWLEKRARNKRPRGGSFV